LSSSHISASSAPLPGSFVTAAYSLDGQNVSWLRPLVRPAACPAARAQPEPVACRISVHHLRHRKTGPCFPIAVLRCAVHRGAFTVYPLGHRPYGRVGLAPVFPDGTPRPLPEPVAGSGFTASDAFPLDAPSANASPAGALPDGALPDGAPPAGDDAIPARLSLRRLIWSATLFGAALDAAAGKAWPRDTAYQPASDFDSPPPALWDTQRRRLAEAARILAIAPAPPPAVGDQCALVLGVPRLALLSAAAAWREARGFVARGRIICSVLERVAPDRRLLNRLLGAGALGGCWGSVSRWDPPPLAAAMPRQTVLPPGAVAQRGVSAM
jgi:hypothetical protein